MTTKSSRSCLRLLESEGSEVSTVQGAHETWEMMRRACFLRIDLKMPNRDGLFLVGQI